MKLPSEPKTLWSAYEWRAKVRNALSRGFADPVAHVLGTTGLSPNKVTITGCLINLGAGLVISKGYLTTGGILVLAAGTLDILDGALARATGKQTRFGAVLDSTMDRLSEAAILFGMLALYSGMHSTPMVLLVYATLVGSVQVSYIRARAEGAGLSCTVGILTRAERTLIIALGLLLNQVPAALWTVALLSYVTAGQRLLHVRHATDNEP